MTIGSISAYAIDDQIDETSISQFATRGAVFSVVGKDATPELKAYFESDHFTVPNDSIIEVLPLYNKEGSQVNLRAICMTTVVGTQVVKDIVIPADQTGILPNPSYDVTGGGSADYVSCPYIDMHATAVCNVYVSSGLHYYSPQGLLWYYSKKKNCTVAEGTVTYVCEGSDYTYPGFVSLNKDVYYSISKSQSNPTANTQYPKTQPYDSSKVIALTGGSGSAGNWVSFDFTVNGENWYYTLGVDIS